jgi:putative membrane protein
MALDLALTTAHHLVVFSLVSLLAVELFMLRPGIDAVNLERLGAVDLFYGIAAAAILVVGVCRVIWGAAGYEFYMGNLAFWLKMGTFVLVGLLSAPPTIFIARARKAAKAPGGALPDASAINGVRRFLYAEAVAFAFLPFFAAAISRGFN